MDMQRKGSSMQPLEFINPGLHCVMRQELESFHLHPYDVYAGGISHEGGFTVVLKYGDRLSNTLEECFDSDALKDNCEEIRQFFRSAGENIKQTLIADYFKMAKS